MFESNFNFLKEIWLSLANLGKLAERYTYTDPNSSLIKLRILCEKIRKHILAYEKIEDTFTFQDSRLKTLEYEKILDLEILKSLHKVRKAGNLAGHEDCKSHNDADELLDTAFTVCVWFMQNYGDWRFKPNGFTFIKPQRQEENNEIDIEKLLIKLESKEKADNEKQLKTSSSDCIYRSGGPPWLKIMRIIH
jgi:type I restriction enzyme R subunit